MAAPSPSLDCMISKLSVSYLVVSHTCLMIYLYYDLYFALPNGEQFTTLTSDFEGEFLTLISADDLALVTVMTPLPKS